MSVCACMYVRVFIHACMHACIQTDLGRQERLRVCFCVVCVYTYMHACIHTYIHTGRGRKERLPHSPEEIDDEEQSQRPTDMYVPLYSSKVVVSVTKRCSALYVVVK